MKITYENKVGVVPKQTHINQVWDDDMNELKTVINANDRIIDGFFVSNKDPGDTTIKIGHIIDGITTDGFDIKGVVTALPYDTYDAVNFNYPNITLYRMNGIINN